MHSATTSMCGANLGMWRRREDGSEACLCARLFVNNEQTHAARSLSRPVEYEALLRNDSITNPSTDSCILLAHSKRRPCGSWPKEKCTRVSSMFQCNGESGALGTNRTSHHSTYLSRAPGQQRNRCRFSCQDVGMHSHDEMPSRGGTVRSICPRCVSGSQPRQTKRARQQCTRPNLEHNSHRASTC